MKPIICVTNQKGGVGKTTTAEAVADGMRRRGCHVLAVDCDPQGSLTAVQSAYVADGTASTADFIKGRPIVLAPGRQATVPAFEELAYVGQELATDGRPTEEDFRALGDAIHRAMDAFDLDACVIDTHPDKDFCVVSALVAATHVIIPTTPDRFGAEGVRQTMDLISDVSEQFGTSWDIGAVVTLYKPFTRLHTTIADQLDTELPKAGVKVFRQRISNHVQVAEAQAEGRSLYDTGRVLHGAAAQYDWLVDDIIDWIGARETASCDVS